MKGVFIAIIFFLLGFAIAHSFDTAPEVRYADSPVAVDSVQRVPFGAIQVYPDEVRIAVPGLRYAKVNSNSMAPIITDKSVVFEKEPDVIHIGDVISFYEPSVDKIILHEVIEIVDQNGQTFYRTKGVANPEADPWLVSRENVKGVMVGTFR